MNNKDELIAIAAKLQLKLLELGFVVHRLDAYTTNSIYLKLDYGVANSIRISDHKGKSNLNYKFNVIIGGKKKVIRQNKNVMHFFETTQIDDLLKLIIHNRYKKVEKLGIEQYNYQMKLECALIPSKRGFWTKAKQVIIPVA